MLRACVFVAALFMSAGRQPALELKLVAADPAILVGQPTRATVTWLARQPVDIFPMGITILIDDGTGWHPHYETRFGTEMTVSMPKHLEPGETWVTSHDIGVTGGHAASDGVLRGAALVFAHPGRYRVKARCYDFVGTERRSIVSNVVAIAVKQPEGPDAALLEKDIRSNPALLTQWALVADRDRLEALFREHPRSPYLDRARLIFLRNELTRIPIQEKQDAAARIRELLSGLVATEPMRSSFEVDRLFLNAEEHKRLGDVELARRFYREIETKYPTGSAAARARAGLKGMEPRSKTRKEPAAPVVAR